MSDMVILVDEHDRPAGIAGKMEAHEEALLHRAFSVLLFNAEGDMLIQKRAHNKYHCAGYWSNACCSHPMPGEDTEEAAHRRLKQELRIDVQQLEYLGNLRYRFQLDNELVEHEFDHIYAGRTDGAIDPDAGEIAETRFVTKTELEQMLHSNEKLTPWFKLILEKFYQIS